MVKFKTKTAFQILDKRNKPLGEFIIRLIVNSIYADASGCMAKGFYYYIDEDGNEFVLDAFNTAFTWEIVEMAETQLPPFANIQNLKAAFEQRIIEFTLIQQQIESGENYGTVYSDWERDVEYDEQQKLARLSR